MSLSFSPHIMQVKLSSAGLLVCQTDLQCLKQILIDIESCCPNITRLNMFNIYYFINLFAKFAEYIAWTYLADELGFYILMSTILKK